MRRARRSACDARRNQRPRLSAPRRRGVFERRRARRPEHATFARTDSRFQSLCVAASLRDHGCEPRHYPTLRDEAAEFEAALATAIAECDAVVVTGGSSVGERDRLPHAVAAVAAPGVVVHGLRVKPGKPTLLRRARCQADSGLARQSDVRADDTRGGGCAHRRRARRRAGRRRDASGAVGANPLAAARTGRGTFRCVCRMMEECPLAHPLARAFVFGELTARADGYIVMEERDDEWPAGTLVTVHRFLGG